ncbi:PDZ domain-containing protein [Thermodesulfovibrio sp. 3907-1M]|uniref:PDZ domain-containing protein n=1 Tax=Thermodesulfovibrio autotrophicus TaxID=3118333 RepID=A0AAU8GZJ8_9BACT
MFTDKNYAKVVITVFILITSILFSTATLYSEESFSTSIKNKFDTIYQRFSDSIIPLQEGVAVAIDNNYAILPATIVEKVKNPVFAVDSKLNIAVIKLNRDFNPVNFDLPATKDEIFFLLTVFEEPSLLIVKGEIKDSKIQIRGKQIPGSLVLSLDLKPIGVVTESDNVSEALLIKPVYSEINKLIKRKPGWLGLQGQTLTAELSKIFNASEGVVITNIYEAGPSDKAGLKRGDVIVEADSYRIKELKDLQNIISAKFAGDTLNLKILRDGIQKDFPVILEEPPETLLQASSSYKSQIKGVEITEIPEKLKTNLKKSIKGVYVNKVKEDSPALGVLKQDDVIIEINKKPVNSINDFNDIISKATGSDLLILVYRQDSFQYVIIPGQKSR